MMNSLLYLTIAFVTVLILHVGLIAFSKSSRRETISEHAAHSTATQLVYLAGHVIAAAAFYLFAASFFTGTPQGQLLINLALIGCIADIIQACIPARGKIEIYHTVVAYIMSFAILSIAFIAGLSIQVPPTATVLVGIWLVALLVCLVIAHTLPRTHFWKVQIVSIIAFYGLMYTLVLT